MAITNLEFPRFRAFDSNGAPLSGGKVYIYQAGTTTDLTTWTDSVKTAENTQPVVLDANGSAEIWFEESAKIDLYDSDDVQILNFPMDNVSPNLPPLISGTYNLVTNGTFDTDDNTDSLPDNWTIVEYTGGTVELDTTAANLTHGTNSLKFTSTGSGGGTATSTSFVVEKNEFILVSWSLVSSVAGVYNKVAIEWFNTAGSSISTSTIYDEATANPTSYKRYAYPIIAPSTAISARIILTGCDSSDSTSGSTWFDNVVIRQLDKPLPETSILYETDFFGDANWTTTTGTVAETRISSLSLADGKSGVLKLTSTGAAANAYGICDVQPSYGDIYFKTSLLTPSDLSDGTDDYTINVSLHSLGTAATTANSIHFRYSHDLSSGNWQTITDDASGTTTNDSGVAVTVDTWFDLEIRINSDGTSCEFYIDGTLVQTHTTNIYTAASMVPCAAFTRDAGTAQRDFYLDYVILRQGILGGR